ncbi:unnamed protein product, partial [Brassica oleracea var. botrytis]
TNIWRRRAHSRHLISLYRSTGARPSWGDDSERDDELNSNTFDWSEKRSSLQLKRAQDREIIIPKRLCCCGTKLSRCFIYVVPARQTTSISSPDDSDDDDLDGDTETADNGDPTNVKRARRAEHSTLLGRLGDMNQKYDAAAVDNRILRADIETREQKYILLNSEKSDRSEPFAVGKTKHGHVSEQHIENPKYYWYRFITKSGSIGEP